MDHSFLVSHFTGKSHIDILYTLSESKYGSPKMKIKSIRIENVGGISSLFLDQFDPNLNIICGENGIGKTNIIESITTCFTHYSDNRLKKRANSEIGLIDLYVEENDGLNSVTCKIGDFKPREDNDINESMFYSFLNKNSKNLLYFKVNRFFQYQWISSLNIHESENEHGRRNLNGVTKNNLKDWFIRSEMLSDKNYTPEIDKENIKFAKDIIKELNPEYEFNSILKDMEIYISSPTGDIPYEYLSAGFKSCIFIIWGIIREIQVRFPNIRAKDFNGVVVIDEIELHLHPEWQNKICDILKKLFPNTQFIITTHSPHIIQSAEKNQVIALTGSNGVLRKNSLEEIAPNGFNGWSIEEILTDVMGMKDIRSEWFKSSLLKFEQALDDENIEDAKSIFAEFESKLHPKSTDLALFRFQLKALTGE